MRDWRHIWIAVAAGLIGAAPSAATLPAPVAAESLDRALLTAGRFVMFSREGKLQSIEAQAMLSGELAGMKEDSVGWLAAPNGVLPAANGGAVVRAPASPRLPWDVYIYLERSGTGWTVHALRLLVVPGLVDEARAGLRAIAKRDAEQEAELRNIDMLYKSDAEFRLWFGEHRGELDAMRGMDPAGALAAAIRLDGMRFERAGGIDRFVIGGMLDNVVGFLFVPEGKPPPPISASDYIWIEPMGGGWYLFRTT